MLSAGGRSKEQGNQRNKGLFFFSQVTGARAKSLGKLEDEGLRTHSPRRTHKRIFEEVRKVLTPLF